MRVLKFLPILLALAACGVNPVTGKKEIQFVSPEAFPVVLSVQYVVMVAVGGLGNVYGAVAGTVAILYLEQKLHDQFLEKHGKYWERVPVYDFINQKK